MLGDAAINAVNAEVGELERPSSESDRMRRRAYEWKESIDLLPTGSERLLSWSWRGCRLLKSRIALGLNKGKVR